MWYGDFLKYPVWFHHAAKKRLLSECAHPIIYAGILGHESSDLNIKLDKIKPKARSSQSWCYIFSNWHWWKLVIEVGGEKDHVELIWKYTERKSIKMIDIRRKVSIKICIWEMIWCDSNSMRAAGVSLKINFSWPSQTHRGTRRNGPLLSCLFIILCSSAQSPAPLDITVFPYSLTWSPSWLWFFFPVWSHSEFAISMLSHFFHSSVPSVSGTLKLI